MSIKFIKTYANALVFCSGTHQIQDTQGHPAGPLF